MSADAQVSYARSLLARFSAASQTVREGDAVTLQPCDEVLKQYFQRAGKHSVASIGEQPLAYSSQRDATSNLAQHTTTGWFMKHIVPRRGRELMKFLLEWGFLRTLSPSGQESGRLLISGPRLLSEGRTTWVELKVFTDFFPLSTKARPHVGADHAHVQHIVQSLAACFGQLHSAELLTMGRCTVMSPARS